MALLPLLRPLLCRRRPSHRIHIGFHRSLQTSGPRPVLPPALALILKPLSRIGAFLLGKGAKRLWRSLPQEQKLKLKEFFLRNNASVGALTGLVTLCGFGVYRSHLETNPISQKEYFMILKPEQMRQVSQKQFDELIEGHQDNLLRASHPAYERVLRVVQRLLENNKNLTGLPDRSWTISVVQNDEINAFVLQNGNIFVFTGMLNNCQNDDQLAIVLSHEIAHVLLNHVEAKLSYASLLSLGLILPLAALWALMPNDWLALLSNWLLEEFSSLLMELPFSRDMEKEADEFGLLLAAKACFDTREGPVFWGRMSLREKLEGQHAAFPPPPIFSSHPTNESREAHLDSLLEESLKVRCANDCPPLWREDPRINLRRLELRAKKRHSYLEHV